MLRRFLGLVVALGLISTGAIAQDNYRIQSGDRLSIEVLQDGDLNRNALVLPDGRFSFPLAGTIRAQGRTVSQVQAALSSALAGNFQAPPDVFVSVEPAPVDTATSASEPAPEMVTIYLLGEIANPGPKELLDGTTFLQALSASGGMTNFAATKRVQLRRTNPTTGLQSVYEINYHALSNGAELRNNFPLQEGDVILVPERRLFE